MQRYVLNHTLWPIPLVLWTVVVGISFAWNWNELDRHSREIAANRAEFVFKMVESVRLWNARHGGVYVPVDEKTRPNRYLEVDERDISTPSGKSLTLLNPAYMTRQLTYVVEELSDVRVHLTSLKPINPDNAADLWETRALEAFEGGAQRVQGFVGEGKDAVYRFMAPLVTQKACLKCHEKQGYEVGDIRGGASVSFTAASLLTPQYEQKWNMAAIHFGIWLLLSGVTLFALSRLRTQMLLLKRAKEQQERVVEQRTAQLRRLAHYDMLTRLPNRSLFHDRLSQDLLRAKRSDEVFALLFLDLDRFKYINDTFGHEAGDQVLVEVARRLCVYVRSSDTVARMGGDEFNIILSGVNDRESVALLAGKILEQMRTPFTVAGTEQRISASVGIACYPLDGRDETELLRNADLAMYRAKQEGRNAFRFHREATAETPRQEH
ncbi:diguanylate cyclase domain-containing protein [Sedimenticola hydrogenitrophicus]|uniref:diguanylate cyclase domain-containing protein n=1 Tax=Sedimenticola hydrogenitrophicus TaxID=2967975 RepID=UPI0021A46FE1|nr:diguanylate cyclase [Sedimenticola hydrogenitrophicus]